MTTTKGAYTMSELSDIIDGALGTKKTTATKAKTVEEPTVEIEASITPATEWEATKWDGVNRRKVSARELFGAEYPDVMLSQYQGFEYYAHLNVPTVPAIYYPAVEALRTLVLSCSCNLKAMLVGDTGTGKTSLAEYFAAKLGRPFARIQFDEFMDDQKLIGSLEVRGSEQGSETYFNKAELVRAMAYPTVACMDEFSRGPSHVTMLVNPILDRGSVTITTHDEKASATVEAVEDFFICATDNTNGTGDGMDVYNSSNVLDEAIRNRFDLYATVPYPSKATELEILLALGMDAGEADKLSKFSFLCHKGFRERTLRTSFSVRNLKAISQLVNAGVPTQDAIMMNMGQRCAKSEVADIQEMVRALWGS